MFFQRASLITIPDIAKIFKIESYQDTEHITDENVVEVAIVDYIVRLSASLQQRSILLAHTLLMMVDAIRRANEQKYLENT